MRGFIVTVVGVSIFGAAPIAMADLSSLVAHKLAARATPSDPNRDTQMRFAWTKDEVVLPPSGEAAAASREPTAAPAGIGHSQFSFGSVDGRFTTRSFTTGFAAAGGF